MTDNFEQLCKYIEKTLAANGRLILSIDGCCASGKTTLAQRLAERFSGDVVHLDDFFLPLPLRTPDRLAEPGGNVHYERFLEQIITPLLTTQNGNIPPLSWQRFDCSCGTFAPEFQHTQGRPLLILEGAYSMRPEFRSAYDASLFLCVSEDVQKQRILSRNGAEHWQAFRDRWIPMENRYFEHYDISQLCSLTLDGTAL